ncbi:PREDICTED: replication protein A 70 kDa DNA-binding subunit isoform X2 [Polistes dominula]|uniref:Replication protein A subunit n=1 Tax=Polistes dominula TaxID=743375 RepID=A0ABM1IUL1_POLDO|nr:PREDICTED: replication protein A 70 kDa DNA-binding subunit isoform X2 [Polistes dominula]XP_015183899.1 PREDICTED: replication protein A 70 kDa DNA-binding subunit isoform X2 [Polistes dominula]
MIPLTEGALDKIMAGEDIDNPIIQILGHKKLVGQNTGERYRLLVSDGKRVNSFTMLATQLNSKITELTDFSICQVNRYAVSVVNNSGKQKRVMVILSIDVKVPGEQVGSKIGNPVNIDNNANGDAEPTKPQTSTVKKPMVTSSVPKSSSYDHSSEITTTPIVALSPYQNKWVIKARVTSKSNIITWSNSRGEGKLFSCDLVDESGEIRCTAFRDQCDKFFDMINVGKIYYISRCNLKTANKQYSTLKNDYEMSMTSETEVIPCHDEVDSIPTIQFDFIPINLIENKERNDIVDILGIVKSCEEVQMLRARTTGRELKKRDVTLIDDSNTMICLSLWGSDAENFNGSNNPVIAIKGARIGEFNGGKNLSTLMSSVLQIDPDIPEAHKLRGWYNTIGMSDQAKSLSAFNSGGMNGEWLSLLEAHNLINRNSNKTLVFLDKLIITLVKSENVAYKSCPVEGCKKKMIDQANGMYRCEKCNKEYPSFKYRILANINFSDWINNQWVTAFNEEAEKVLNMTSQELGELQENNQEQFLEKLTDVTFKYFLVKLRMKVECFNDESRIKANCLSISAMDYKTHNDVLLTKLKDFLGIEML